MQAVGGTAETISRLLQIVLINLVLSGDNAVVIGMAAHPLPPRQRRMAIAIGGGGAIVLRIVLTGLAAFLLQLPAVRAIGGALLLWIAFQLLQQEDEPGAGRKVPTTLRGAVATVLVADLVMSMDNVLGVAAASNGDFVLLIFGLIVSMAIVTLGGGIIARLIDRLWWLAYLGAAVIAWTGSEMMQDDDLVVQASPLSPLLRLALTVIITLAVVTLAHVVHRRKSDGAVRLRG
jgi:YjbE family integral membrane protein